MLKNACVNASIQIKEKSESTCDELFKCLDNSHVRLLFLLVVVKPNLKATGSKIDILQSALIARS